MARKLRLLEPALSRGCRVVGILKRSPTSPRPAGIDQRESQTLQYADQSRIEPAGRGKNGAPKQVENVALYASVEPIEPTAAV